MIAVPLSQISFLLFLLFLFILPQCDSAPLPLVRQEEESNRSERLTFLFLHIFGVAAAMVASATRLSYPSTIFMDACMTIVFYLAVSITLAIALYVTYRFQSPDMLLVGAAVGVVIAWRSVPRLWSTYARRLHWSAPMWRTRNGNVYKRTRRRLRANELSSTEFYWNARVFQSQLIDGSPIQELVESKPRHWEKSVHDWQTYVSRGRLGDRAARRAAMALRMAYTVPLPLCITCGPAEYYAARGALGVEVANVWKMDQNSIASFSMLSQRSPSTFAFCEQRTELAVVLHLKILLYRSGNDDDRGGEREWDTFVTEWLFGELICSDGAPLDDVLASGKVGGGGNKYWNLITKSDDRMEQLRYRNDPSE